MNEKQLRFCEEYIKDHNATQAAIRSGYSQKTAGPAASRLLTNVNIQGKIQELAGEVKANTIAEATEVLEFFTQAMRGEIRDQVVKRDEEGNLHTVDVQARASDRLRAAESLAKHYALLVEKVELTKPKAELAAEIEAAINGGG